MEIYEKVVFDITWGDTVTIVAHLPPGFTMQTFTKIFFLKDAGDDPEAYMHYQQDELFKDIVNRLTPEEARRIANG